MMIVQRMCNACNKHWSKYKYEKGELTCLALGTWFYHVHSADEIAAIFKSLPKGTFSRKIKISCRSLVCGKS